MSAILVITGIIAGLGSLATIILMLVGLGYMTAMVFGNKTYDELTTTQKNITRMTTVIVWIAFGFAVIGGIIKALSGGSKGSSSKGGT
jgi:predicted permease